MVHGADEVVDAWRGGEGVHGGRVGGPDELGFEGDEDVDLRCVEGLQAEGFDEVGLVAGGKGGDGGLGVVELVVCEMGCVEVCKSRTKR